MWISSLGFLKSEFFHVKKMYNLECVAIFSLFNKYVIWGEYHFISLFNSENYYNTLAITIYRFISFVYNKKVFRKYLSS